MTKNDKINNLGSENGPAKAEKGGGSDEISEKSHLVQH